jgi:hypothetical protein
MSDSTLEENIRQLRAKFEEEITDPELVEHQKCGGFEYEHLVADIFEITLEEAILSLYQKELESLVANHDCPNHPDDCSYGSEISERITKLTGEQS